jgi:hypothetical protein
LRYPFQRAEDLALATGGSIATVYRHLNVLHDNSLVERVMAPALGTVKCWLYHLSNPGLLVLAAHEMTDPTELARSWNNVERGFLNLLPRLVSLITIQDCLNGLVTFAPEVLTYRGRRSEVRWHWVRDYAHRFSYREKLMRCTADAALLLRVRTVAENGTSMPEKWYSLLVLLDTEFAGDTWLKQRLGRLLCYRESAERWPVYQHFPPVLVLVSTPRRLDHWQWCAREAASVLHVEPLTGAIVCVPNQPETVPYNPWPLAWKTLATHGPCILQNQLHPLPIPAILPGLSDRQLTGTVTSEKRLTNNDATDSTSSPALKRSNMIVGNYMDRAKTIPKDHTVDSHLERETIALLGLSLGQHHIALLTLLFKHPLLHGHEIAALLERESSSIKRYLGVLRGSGCIEPLATSAGQRWRLSERGIRLVAAMQHVNLHKVAIQQENNQGVNLVQQGVDMLMRHVEHTAGIYGFFASLSREASWKRLQGHDHRLLWWEIGASCERRYHDQEHWHNLRPDAIAEYLAGEKRVRFWLEWDRGTIGMRDLVAKLRSYEHYVASREWFKQEAALPMLLVVTPDPGQERRFGRAVTATLTDRCGPITRTTTLTRACEHGYLGPIWSQELPDSEGTDPVPRRLFYL